jgi:Uncharacterized protein conserved in bacteria (DUF2188)
MSTQRPSSPEELAMSKAVHVMPSDGGWDVTEEGSGRTKHFDTQGEALKVSREMAQHNRSEQVIHSRDGMIRQRDSFGRDPFPHGAR